jgi:hypothetical protein
MFWVSCADVATSSAAPQAGRPIHSNWSMAVGARPCAAVGSGATAGASRARHPHHAQAAANSTNPADQTAACAGRSSQGSTTNGYEINASSDPAFDSAYSRYGERPGCSRARQS